jgi:HD-GYP domain-containing protein (c-di-GMP phosphodiesterase class II)
VTAATPTATSGALSDDALVEYGRTNTSRHLARWDSTGLLAFGFLVVAICALALPSHRELSIQALAIGVACYTLASRVQFEFGGVFALPTQPVLVALWFLLPPRMLPLVVFGSLLLSALPDLFAKRMPPDRLALVAVSSWFSVGPALVIFLWGTHEPTWRAVPVYLAALAAQMAFDLASMYLCARPVIGISLLGQVKAMRGSFLVDLLLAPLGLLVGFAVYGRPWTLLLVLPMLGLFATFAKERQHRLDHALDLSTAYRGTAILLGDVIEADDEYTGAHSRDVVELVLAVADRLGLDARERQRAEFAALLHDVGKVKIPSDLINKPGPLEPAERALMNTHTIIGQNMLDQVGGMLGEVGHIVRSCHERWDGAGYPDGLAGESIPLAARIVCACDAWSAMTTDRAYRKALPRELAAAELCACAGTQFDPRVVAALVAVLEL